MRISRVTTGWMGLVGILMLVLAGCAQNPQYLQVKPGLTKNLSQVGNGQSVTVNVVDGRESDVLGTRNGAAMSTATITVEAHTLMPQLQEQAETALREMGFSPTRQSADNQPSLTLTLTQLSFEENDDRLMLDKALLIARLRADVKNDRTTYTGNYTAKRTQSYAVTPDTRTNTRMVSDLLSDALDRTFSDPQIGNLLAR